MIELAPSIILSSDASLTGWGAVCEEVTTFEESSKQQLHDLQ